jgi:hypothetical protein
MTGCTSAATAFRFKRLPIPTAPTRAVRSLAAGNQHSCSRTCQARRRRRAHAHCQVAYIAVLRAQRAPQAAWSLQPHLPFARLGCRELVSIGVARTGMDWARGRQASSPRSLDEPSTRRARWQRGKSPRLGDRAAASRASADRLCPGARKSGRVLAWPVNSGGGQSVACHRTTGRRARQSYADGLGSNRAVPARPGDPNLPRSWLPYEPAIAVAASAPARGG